MPLSLFLPVRDLGMIMIDDFLPQRSVIASTELLLSGGQSS